MISIEESKKHLGKLGEKLSDEKIGKLRNELYQIINMLLDNYYEVEKQSSKSSIIKPKKEGF